MLSALRRSEQVSRQESSCLGVPAACLSLFASAVACQLTHAYDVSSVFSQIVLSLHLGMCVSLLTTDQRKPPVSRASIWCCCP
jgi:hypothetical protein